MVGAGRPASKHALCKQDRTQPSAAASVAAVSTCCHRRLQAVVMQVEAAYDVVLMQSMRRRIQGEVDSRIKYADVKKARPAPQQVLLRVWACASTCHLECAGSSDYSDPALQPSHGGI